MPNTSNKDIANILHNIAKLLSIKGESIFRIQAYENAANNIEFLDRELADVYKQSGEKGLDSIEGIGGGIAERVAELLRTGQMAYYENLRHSIPSVVLQLLDIPGVGPKTAIKLAQKLHLQNLDELPNLLNSPLGKSHFSLKQRENIIQGYLFLHNEPQRLLIDVADSIADQILAALKQSPHVQNADPVGSLRRRKERIGDIDIVASSDSPDQAVDYLIKQPFVKDVLSQGGTKISLIHKRNVRVDIEILPPQVYGSLLQHFTGSKEHNIHLRTYAETKNISISEHGLKLDNRLIACASEKCVYNHLGMDWMPPELREDRGEIEAALQHRLPDLIKISDIKGDLHTHSNWTDGRSTIEEMARAAHDLGYEYIVISDHTKSLGVAHGLNEDEIIKRQKEIAAANKLFPNLTVLSGLEVDIHADGKLDIDDEILSQMDVVIASIHSGFKENEKVITNRIVNAMFNPHIDIIGHPSGRLLDRRPPMAINWPEVFRQAAITSTTLEINASPNRLDLNDALVFQAREYNVRFAINTDAHHTDQLKFMRYGLDVGRRGWLEKLDVINTFSLVKLQKLLAKTNP